MRRILLTAAIMAIGILAYSALSFAAVPELINYQGRLTNPAGTPLDTTVSMIFSFYAYPVGGSPIWADTIGAVAVANGLFNATLDVYDPGDGSFGNETSKFIGITVGSNPEIIPRTPLTSAPYAFHSATVDNFNPGTNNVDSGAYSFTAGDSNKVLSDYSSIAGGFKNEIDITSTGDTLVDTSFTPDFTGGAHLNFGGRNPGYGSFIGAGALNHSHGAYSAIGAGLKNTTWCGFSGILAGVVNEAGGYYSFVGAGAYNVIGQSNCSGCGLSSGIVAGAYNNIQGNYAFIGGGLSNRIQGCFAYNTIGGGRGNIVSNNYAFIGGGGYNTASGQYSTIGGGGSNSAIGQYSTVGGGLSNQAAGIKSTIGGGDSNYVATAALRGTISGGYYNAAYDIGAAIGGGYFNNASGQYSTVGGGFKNKALGFKSTIGGGDTNLVWSDYGTVGGGQLNSVIERWGTIAGGDTNSVRAGYGSIGGGRRNLVDYSAWFGTIAGGDSNHVVDTGGAILGGRWNTTSGMYACIGGGTHNYAGGQCAAIPGGDHNMANGYYSLAAGQNAQTIFSNTFIWNDNPGAFAATGANQFLIHASGNIGIMTNAPHSTLHDNGSFAVGYRSTGGTITATSSDCVIEGTASLTINLPTAVGIAGRIYTIKNTGGVGTTVTVDASGAELIDGSLTYGVGSMLFVTIVSNGIKWLVIGN